DVVLTIAADEILGVRAEICAGDAKWLVARQIRAHDETSDARHRHDQAAVLLLGKARDPSRAAHAPQGKGLSRRRFRIARIMRWRRHADEAIARERVIDEGEIAWLEHIERERGARQQNGPAQRK